MEPNKFHPQKGLSDKQLIAKYESGKINIGKVLKPVINKIFVKTPKGK